MKLLVMCVWRRVGIHLDVVNVEGMGGVTEIWTNVLGERNGARVRSFLSAAPLASRGTEALQRPGRLEPHADIRCLRQLTKLPAPSRSIKVPDSVSINNTSSSRRNGGLNLSGASYFEMILPRRTLIGALVAAVAHAAQPGAVEPVAAPMRDLTWGQLNFLHTTDTHGWLGGHLQEWD